MEIATVSTQPKSCSTYPLAEINSHCTPENGKSSTEPHHSNIQTTTAGLYPLVLAGNGDAGADHLLSGDSRGHTIDTGGPRLPISGTPGQGGPRLCHRRDGAHGIDTITTVDTTVGSAGPLPTKLDESPNVPNSSKPPFFPEYITTIENHEPLICALVPSGNAVPHWTVGGSRKGAGRRIGNRYTMEE
ncbi:hypothetical protein KY290_036580 [Solanum tuberosum]|uniref:Uncharacterized protein n=1 Tax=Solanum tuberosum TaxID=4113 RepID=A0ABQ7TTK2_SOLTU|nr:hypothetical protein KY285_035902 [Solanum tuberosum]KAH0737875.1 hypothetical protein KY290_036580 [Solanum tuberosum]